MGMWGCGGGGVGGISLVSALLFTNSISFDLGALALCQQFLAGVVDSALVLDQGH